MRSKRRTNDAAEQVTRWDELWRAWLAARAAGDFARIESVRKQIEAFDQETGAQPLRCTMRKA